MFTGIIEELGQVLSMDHSGDAIVMKINAEKILKDVQLGDSISVNGVCLTVTSYEKDMFTADVMPETVKATSLKQLSLGDVVNLERAMPADGRFGGHFVSGHVDGVGTIISKQRQHNAVYFRIRVPETILPYLMNKGSVAVDGISLTIFGINESTLTVSIIPHTLNETVLGSKGPGDLVNLEADVIAKYVERLLFNSDNKLTASFLEKNGFK